MKKFLTLLASTLFILVLAACGTSEGNSEESSNGNSSDSASEEGSSDQQSEEVKELTIGASSTPHAEILEEAKPLLKEKGIKLNIETYQDYILPNKDLSSGAIDANYFQHTPYLEDQKKEFGYDFASIGPVHIEPMGVYSKNINSIDEIPKGTEVIMSRSVADHGRILSLFESKGIIELKEGIDKKSAKIEDIAKNPKNLKFSADVDAGLLPQNYEREEDALVAINTNYAIEAGLNPTEDSLFMEGSESPYANLLVTKSENKDSKALQTVLEVLQSEEIKQFMKEKYNGAIVPVSK
ncbi:methionine ABC transporter substrate-binding protein [Pontibacillus yanchengensis]|uniref:Methionine ABC transporter substrate-binding protein n=2 Tax=Pontibacillus yanchengensis TaxID=462910 RepID=A0ACC7VKT5_9BACI|nr:MetQ/NlpA family ABC transporter substrate-binding protein [Pontibacillus yanchengensis]MYL33719.1 methionine ABC transporter substrate-binding protein [Pontibacillus yanchengensis]MYL55383.1 methionine ABC transporter substrate-binding protein [Pontibacillus yanchengensis]